MKSFGFARCLPRWAQHGLIWGASSAKVARAICWAAGRICAVQHPECCANRPPTRRDALHIAVSSPQAADWIRRIARCSASGLEPSAASRVRRRHSAGQQTAGPEATSVLRSGRVCRVGPHVPRIAELPARRCIPSPGGGAGLCRLRGAGLDAPPPSPTTRASPSARAHQSKSRRLAKRPHSKQRQHTPRPFGSASGRIFETMVDQAYIAWG